MRPRSGDPASLVHDGHGAAALLNIALPVMVAQFASLAGWSPSAICLTFDGLASAQEFLKILEPWVTLGRLTNSGEVFYGEKTSEGFDI